MDVAMTLLCVFLTFSFAQSLRPLNEFIKHYETLDYNPGRTARFARRSTHSDPVSLTIKAFGRKMNLVLQRDLVTLGPDVQIVDGRNRRINIDRHSFVVGKLSGEDGSDVYGVFTKAGIFTGTVDSPRYGRHFIEPAQRHFDKPTDFHSVIYRSKDVRYNSSSSWPSEGTPTIVQRDRHLQSRSERRRSKRRSPSEYERNICGLYLTADYTFRDMSGGNINAVHIMVNHIIALNAIFRDNFNTTKTFAPHGIRFKIAMIKILNKDEANDLLDGNTQDSSKFLESIWNTDYKGYCEALFFTYRAFESGLYGRARRKGACYLRNNMAFVTFKRGDMKLPTPITEIVVAHEIAHALGAQHDTKECQPSGKEGTFIMHVPGITGIHHNNYLFSKCSVDEMMEWINKELRPKCFNTSKEWRDSGWDCGNGMIDEGEECDCGDEYTCKYMDPHGCCNSTTCKRKEGVNCSGSEGPCCNTSTCTFKKEGELCMQAQECLQSATCPGNSSKCRRPAHKPDRTECFGNTTLCENGNCTLSICKKFGYEGCFCEERHDKCKICCLHKGVCQPAEHIDEMKSKISATYLIAGASCADGTGYCDMFHYCHEVDMRGPILYFLKKGVKEVTRRFWWAILLGTIGLIGCIVLLIKYGALYTPSSYPAINRTQPARKVSLKISFRQKKEEQQDMMGMNDINS